MTYLNCSCSQCGRSYGALRVNAGVNYCSTACRSKAYRIRKIQATKAKKATLDIETYSRLRTLATEYGEHILDKGLYLFEEFGLDAVKVLIFAIHDCTMQERKKALRAGGSK